MDTHPVLENKLTSIEDRGQTDTDRAIILANPNSDHNPNLDL